MKSPFKNIATIFILFIFSFKTDAQNIAINSSGNTGNSAAILDLSDASNNNLGLALPNVSIGNVSSANPVVSPPEGLIVYNTNAAITGGFGKGFYYWSAGGAQWYYINNSGSPSVTSVGLTGPGGIMGITNTNGNPITSSGSFGITTTGTSGGIPYFSSGLVLSSSALLVQYGIVVGGGAGGTPATTAALTNGQVLIGSTGVAPIPATITPASNSGISITNSAGSITIGTNGVLNNIVTILNGTTSYTPSVGTKAIQVELIGGGGGGGSTTSPGSNCSAGAGGGGGGYVKFMLTNPIGPFTVAVGGSGGGGSGGSSGSSGGSTTFNTGATTYTAGGGSGGAVGNANYSVSGGAGGANSGGATVSINGNPGGNSGNSNAVGGVSGIGGSSVLGGGGASVSITAAHAAISGNQGATNSGSGGSGGIIGGQGGSATATGGAGANGIIIITEYK